MDVGLVGGGPGIEAAAAALEDVDVTVERCEPGDLADAALGIASGTAGDGTFGTVDDVAPRWLAIEVGGLGGIPLEDLDAAVAGFGPETACYRCLSSRVRANAVAPAEEPRADRSALRLAGAIAGREAVRLLSGEDRILGRVIEVPHAQRTVLPVPGCDCETDAPASAPISREYRDRDLEATVDAADLTIDPRVGLIAQIGEAESFPAPYYLATLADTTTFSDGDAPDQAAGVADDWNAAFAKAAGEALERYAGAIYRDDEFRRAASADLEDAVAPSAFAGAGDDAPGPEAAESIRWVEGERLLPGGGTAADGQADADRTWLPADAVHFPSPGSTLPAITTGLGLRSSPVGALLSGLTEVVERDAAMLAWYSTFEPLALSVDDERFERLARRARGEGLTVTPLLVTQDVDVPVVAVAVHREEGWPKFAVAADADPSPTDAAVGALQEAVQNWMELRSVGEDDVGDLDGAIGEYADFPGSAQSMVDAGDPIPAEQVGPDEPPTGQAALDAVLDALDEAGLDAYAARLTTRDLERVGFEAVRVVVPEAQPLFTGSPRFGERARSIPGELGFKARLDRDHHPYP